jgi:hypothetical protein
MILGSDTAGASSVTSEVERSPQVPTKGPDRLLDLYSPRIRYICRWIIAVVVIIGSAARFKQYITRPSYWNDEAAIVINVIHRDYAHLLNNLDYAQVAPPLFLWCERGLLKTFGPSEYSLRLLPFMLSLLSLPLFARLAWRTLPPTSACWAVAWLTFFQRLVHNGIDVKQYSGDLCISIVLMLIVLTNQRSVSAMKRMAMLSCIAAIALWMSFPTIFTFGALALTILPEAVRSGMKSIAYWLAGCVLPIVSFFCLYHFSLSASVDRSLLQFWQDSFPDVHYPLYLPIWIGRHIYGAFAYPFESLGAIASVLILTGSIAILKLRQGKILSTLLIALSMAFIASALHRYPFPGRNRLSLYILPLTVLILAAGAEGQNLNMPAWLCRWWWIIPSSLLLLQMGQLCKEFAVKEESSTTREVVAYVRVHRQTAEPIYLVGDFLFEQRASGRNAEFLCYWPDVPGKIVVGSRDPKSITAKRFWVVYSLNHPEKGGQPFSQQLLQLFGPHAHLLDSCQPGHQSGAMLLEIT